MTSPDFFDDIPDEVLEADSAAPGIDDVDEIIEKAQHQDEPADIEQETLLTYATQNADIWVRAQTILKPQYFEPEYRKVIRFVQEYYKKHGQLPPKRIIYAETKVNLDVVEDADREDIVDHILLQTEAFCRMEAARAAAIELVDKFGDPRNFSKTQLAAIIKRFGDIQNISLNRDLGMEIHADIREYLEIEKEFGAIPTKIGFLDQALGGGVSQPSLNVVSASSGQGKSIFLANIAFNYVLDGKNVIFYSLELEVPMVAKRFAAIMTDTDIGLVSSHIASVASQLKLSASSQGELWVKKFPMNTTMAEIESHYRDLCLETGKKFDVVCIDYIDVMAPVDTSIKRGELHIKDKDIAEDMNNFFHNNNIIGWTASQQTKTAVEERELKSSNVSGGRSKIDTADNLIMLRRNEEEREQERLWAIIRKARSSGGVDSKIPLRWNGKTQRMGDGDMDMFIRENPHIFGERSRKMREEDEKLSDAVKHDAIAQEQGLVTKKEETKSEKAQRGIQIRSTLRDTINAGKQND